MQVDYLPECFGVRLLIAGQQRLGVALAPGGGRFAEGAERGISSRDQRRRDTFFGVVRRGSHRPACSSVENARSALRDTP